MKNQIIFFLALGSIINVLSAQNQRSFYLGADLSYINEMEDCGAIYHLDNVPVDPYATFAERGANMVRLRLWHTPAWYDNLNSGQRYSDLADVKRSIARAKAQGMAVLLDFHLSDNWADPSKQVIPTAWAGVANNLPVLQDSLYNYIFQTLLHLHSQELLPEMVQIGNETNKGILQTQAQNDAGWVLNWPRNAALFNSAISAVRAVESATGQSIQIALHIADPEEAGWLMQGFYNNNVRDFDVIGLSYYWAWHQPLTMAQTGAIIAQLRNQYPGKEVMIFETAYIWTTQANDQANNIINAVQSGYSPASPDAQRRWMIDLTQAVVNSGGLGVLYWEPAWVSTACRTQWGQGSHQEHAAFYDFNNNLIETGGINFFSHPYDGLSSLPATPTTRPGRIYAEPGGAGLVVKWDTEEFPALGSLTLMDMGGRVLLQHSLAGTQQQRLPLPTSLPAGVYWAVVSNPKGVTLLEERILLMRH